MARKTWAEMKRDVTGYVGVDVAWSWTRMLSGANGRVWQLEGRYYPASAGSDLETALVEAGAESVESPEPALVE